MQSQESAPLPPKRRRAMARALLRLLRAAPHAVTVPPLSRETFPPPEGPLEVLRDANGVSHIYATHEPDLYLAVGYLQAADRWVLIDVLRHLGAGRMCELIGDLRLPGRLLGVRGRGLRDLDAFVRPLGFEAQSRHDYARLGNRARACLDAFARGANAALRAMDGVYPPEYLFLGRIRPWEGADCLLAARTCAFVVALTPLENELLFDAVRGEVGDETARRLFPDAPWENAPASYTARGAIASPEPPLHGTGGGSNNWVVAAGRSASGAPIFANDPHVPLLPLPTFWHHVHLDCPRYRVQGGMFPGCPAFGYGHNPDLAWGVTTGYRDAWDLYRIHRLPEEPGRYRVEGGSGEIRAHEEELRTRRGRRFTVRWESCEHGILYPGWVHHDGTPLALRHVPSDLAEWFEGHLDLMAAATVEEHRRALARINEGPFDFNLVYAHREGEIAWEPVGKLPRRPADGLFVRDADDPMGRWDGFLAFEEMPKLRNPPEGLIATANSLVDPPRMSPIATPVHFEPLYRQERIRAALAAADRHDREAMARLQADLGTDYGVPMRDAIVALVERSCREFDETGRAALAVLREWDGSFRGESPGAAIFYFLRAELTQRVFGPLLGPLGRRYASSRRAWPRLHRLLVDRDDPLRPDIEAAAGTSLAQLAAEAFAAAVRTLTRRDGADPRQWRWDRRHRIRLGTLSMLLPLVGRRFVALDAGHRGDEYTVSLSARPLRLRGTVWALVGATSRFICDLANPLEAYFAHSSGPSGRAESRLYANLSAPWHRHEYFRSALWAPRSVPDVVERFTAGGESA